MLSEHFVASIGVPSNTPGTNVAKDAAIFLHEFQPLAQQRAVFKKSATAPNCLAISESHIFAAQEGKGAVHVYSREKGNQEATVPFTEKISSIALACDDAVLVLGTVEGRIFLWETCTGRQVATGQAHLQAVTVVAVDATSNFLLSASKDATAHVWSIPQMLSFSHTGGASPLRTFSSHHAEITSLVLGHGAFNLNFAISTSKDKTCLVWDYKTGNVLRTYLLPGTPLCSALDPADRAVYVGYDDGSLQQLDLYTSPTGELDAVQNGQGALDPVQPPAASRWKLPDTSHGAALSLDVSYDSSVVLTGHNSGAVLSWDVARGSFATNLTPLPLPGPASNLKFLPVSGHHDRQSDTKKIKINEIVKPKFGAFDSSGTGVVPGNYAASVQFPSDLDQVTPWFRSALTAPTFPTNLLDEGLDELANWGKMSNQSIAGADADDDDFMSFSGNEDKSASQSLQEENTALKAQLESMRRLQKKSFEKLSKLSDENRHLLQKRQSKSKVNGAQIDSD
ncbi:Pre-rRNA-processing protein IPI3 [Cercospora zeina]